MRKTRRPIGPVFLLLMFVASHVLVIGCNDPSRTSGTMVEESEEAKAHRQKKMEKMEALRKEKAAAKAVKKGRAR